jgi:hypothetical protein
MPSDDDCDMGEVEAPDVADARDDRRRRRHGNRHARHSNRACSSKREASRSRRRRLRGAPGLAWPSFPLSVLDTDKAFAPTTRFQFAQGAAC